MTHSRYHSGAAAVRGSEDLIRMVLLDLVPVLEGLEEGTSRRASAWSACDDHTSVREPNEDGSS